MGKSNFSDEFKRDAVAQITERGYPAAAVSERLGVSQHSMSRRGNCHDNAVAESFFNLLKRERIRRRTDKTREDARRDVFGDIEMFYNSKRKHVRNGMLSPIECERQGKRKQQGV